MLNFAFLSFAEAFFFFFKKIRFSKIISVSNNLYLDQAQSESKPLDTTMKFTLLGASGWGRGVWYLRITKNLAHYLLS